MYLQVPKLREGLVAFSASCRETPRVPISNADRRAVQKEAGKAGRAGVPRSSHREWSPASRDPLSILRQQDEPRVAELVPIRYGRMLASPFAFFRGGAAVMAADLAMTPSAGFEVQLCGDAHLSNFGVFAAPDRRL